MAVMKVFDLSTSHLNAKDALLLTDACHFVDEPATCPVRVTSHNYGWILFLSDKEAKPSKERYVSFGFSEVLFAVSELAYQQGCQFINFDADGDVLDGLPVGDFA
jgi:hypothetical protein